MRALLLGISLFIPMFNGFAAHLSPWKVTVLNGFPDVARSITGHMKEALLLLESKKSPDVLQKQLTQKLADVEASVVEAKAQLEANKLPEDLFSEVDLDVIDLKRNVASKNFKAVMTILKAYESALDRFVFVK